ncbi:MAG: SPOR domain-containing protein [Candidatus Omnitrophica bacterium]|nr:SPOR domain-containing protein [Candidatus Omnitrophota bacterium]
MEEENRSQLELFSQVNKDGERNHQQGKSFIYHIRGHEKAIILVMFFIISSIVSFSLGVERGKTIALRKNGLNIELAEANLPQKKAQAAVLTTLPAVKVPEKTVTPLQNFIQNYTIQVATFATKVGADKEAAIFKKKGLPTLVFSKGKYTILCVGKFADKETAKPTLSELKKQYRDCFVRRI